LIEASPKPKNQVKEECSEYVAHSREKSEGLGLCKTCGEQCMIKWGRYCYYWKCLACDTNMSIKEYCPTYREKQKLRKAGKKFYLRCEPCETERLYCEFEDM